MTKGELLVSIIKSLGYNGENRLNSENISEQDDYFEVTSNACEIINRGLTRLFDSNKLPKKSFYITDLTETVDTGNDNLRNKVRYDLNYLITDFGKLNDIYIETNNGNLNASLLYEGDYIVLDKLRNSSNNRYVLIYTPKISRIYEYMSDSTNLPYKDEIYEKLVYYVKAEMLEETNTSLALHYRNLFEEYIHDDDEAPEVARKVKDVYNMF